MGKRDGYVRLTESEVVCEIETESDNPDIGGKVKIQISGDYKLWVN